MNIQAIPTDFERALLLHRQGKILEAEAVCSAVLLLQPAHVGALHLMGLVALQTGRPAQAVDLIRRSLEGNPNQPFALLHLGTGLHAMRRVEEALACYERALRIEPAFLPGQIARGNALRELGDAAGALACFELVVGLAPDNAAAHYNRGNALRDLGRTSEALLSYERALQIHPEFAEALNARGNALLALGRPAEALASYDRALRLRPQFAEAHSNRGNALRQLRQFDAALESFGRAVQLGESRPGALGNYAWALMEAQRFGDAIPWFARLLSLAPDYPYARGAMLFAQLNACDWSSHAQTVQAVVAAVRADQRVTAPFPLLAVCDLPEEHLRCARLCAAHKYPSGPVAEFRHRPEHDRIRVAYVSADLRDHVVSHLLAPLLERHDRTRFEVTAISLSPPDPSPAGRRIRAAFERFLDVSALSDDAVAALMRELEVDIAVDLGGFTGEHRLGIFARRPAPVQVSYLGYPGTTGTGYIDYLLADGHLIPDHLRHAYSESVIHLPHCYQVNHRERPRPPRPPTRAECGLPEEGLVFCCFNNSFKLNPDMFRLWMRLLHEIGASVLWLSAYDPGVVRNLRSAAAAQGIAPERLVFAQRRPQLSDHLARYLQADLFLDTFPFNAHATASDALWYAVPIVTCRGRSFASRVASSLLHCCGLPELIAEDLAQYERIVLQLARDPERLREVRSSLAGTLDTCALFDTDRFRRSLESAYAALWDRHRRGLPPADFHVTVTSGS